MLPGEPSTSGGNFLRMKDLDRYPNKECRFRVLEVPFATGFQLFTDQSKPVMRMAGDPFPTDVKWKQDLDGTEGIPKAFWACPVWNYIEKKVQLWSFTQGTVHKQLRALFDDDDWGDPTAYDMKLRRAGSGMDMEYTLTPGAKKPLDGEPAAAWEKVRGEWTGLSALFAGKDPFATFDLPF